MKDDRLYLIQIIECAERVARYTAGGEEAFFEAEKTQDAVLRNLQVAAEATKDLPEEMRASRPDVEWRSIRSFRNRVVHDYLGVDLRVVWRITQNDLPALGRVAAELLRERESAAGGEASDSDA